jgi:integrase/recombinase XerD
VFAAAKGGRIASFRFPEQTMPALETYMRHRRPELVRGRNELAFFVSGQGTRLRAPGLRVVVRRQVEEAGIARNVFPHLLRHSYATHLVEGGAAVRHVQELQGHESIETTAVYTRVALKDLESVIQKHPRRRGGKPAQPSSVERSCAE